MSEWYPSPSWQKKLYSETSFQSILPASKIVGPEFCVLARRPSKSCFFSESKFYLVHFVFASWDRGFSSKFSLLVQKLPNFSHWTKKWVLLVLNFTFSKPNTRSLGQHWVTHFHTLGRTQCPMLMQTSVPEWVPVALAVALVPVLHCFDVELTTWSHLCALAFSTSNACLSFAIKSLAYAVGLSLLSAFSASPNLHLCVVFGVLFLFTQRDTGDFLGWTFYPFTRCGDQTLDTGINVTKSTTPGLLATFAPYHMSQWWKQEGPIARGFPCPNSLLVSKQCT